MAHRSSHDASWGERSKGRTRREPRLVGRRYGESLIERRIRRKIVER